MTDDQIRRIVNGLDNCAGAINRVASELGCLAIAIVLAGLVLAGAMQ